MHVGTHGPYVCSNGHMYSLKKPCICVSFTLDGRTNRASPQWRIGHVAKKGHRASIETWCPLGCDILFFSVFDIGDTVLFVSR